MENREPAARKVPREPGIDHTLAFLREGYCFIGNRCRRCETDAFETRLLLRRVVCMQGPEAAELVYAGDRFTRVGAMPPQVLRLLQDKGSVQQLDGEEHRHRKSLFVSIGQPSAATVMAAQMACEWKKRFGHWEETGRIVLFDEVRSILTRVAAAWAGIRLDPAEIRLRTHELSEMVEATGALAPHRILRAMMLRGRCERWAQGVIRRVRAGEMPAAEDSPVKAIASHREADGTPLDIETAAVELLNILRPTVAVSRYIVFSALALHEHPQVRRRIAEGDDEYLAAFAEEVRRTFPFFPFVGGRARHELDWRGVRFPQGAWVLLDLYGTNHHPRIWPDPSAFRPERFLQRLPSPFEYVPQGAGDVSCTHRCPGEPITIELIRTATKLLVASMRYEVPRQDLTVDLSHIPALPKSGFIMSDIRAKS